MEIIIKSTDPNFCQTSNLTSYLKNKNYNCELKVNCYPFKKNIKGYSYHIDFSYISKDCSGTIFYFGYSNASNEILKISTNSSIILNTNKISTSKFELGIIKSNIMKELSIYPILIKETSNVMNGFYEYQSKFLFNL